MWPFPKKKKEIDIFSPKNAILDEQERDEFVGLTGTYNLVITPYRTGSGTWNYTRGEVFLNGVCVATVDRNYSSFPYVFVKHPNGFDYLVCGEDYQGQTVIELNTGSYKNTLSPGAEDGNGFCWAHIESSEDGQSLIVTGCIWGGEYEEHIIDFKEPFNMIDTSI